MRITERVWMRYVNRLRRLSDRASNEMRQYLSTHETETQAGMNAAIDYAYALATKYGEGSGTLACEMYDAIAELQGANVPAAVPAQTATIDETAKAVVGTMKTRNYDIVADATGRLVKVVGLDTMLNNAERDGAEFAWVPMGDTCAFCLTIASRGWQTISARSRKNGHAEHVHANCDCTYIVRFDDNIELENYNPQEYRGMYYEADGDTPKQRINALRREFYAENKEIINEQKRSAYAKRMALNSPEAEEINVD